MDDFKKLLENNREWAGKITDSDPDFFTRSAAAHKPLHLWIGCADSRIPANEVIGLGAGELFVHRNVGNMVYMTDMNCLTVLQYAVYELNIKNIILCGHYGCGGVKAAMDRNYHGLADNWVYNIRDIYQIHQQELDGIEDETARLDRLCELNVCHQVENLCHTTILRSAWDLGKEVNIYGVVYNIRTGLLQDLGIHISNMEQADNWISRQEQPTTGR